MADNKCDCNAVMQEVVDDIKNNMFSEEEINGVALDKREVCVCDLAAALGMTKSAVSHQLALLKANNIVKARRDGKHVFYSFDDEHITTVIEIADEHIRHQHLGD